MAGLTRKTLIQFGSTGPSSSFGQFGSKTAGTPQTSQNLDIIQQLPAWIAGWQNAVVGSDKAAYLEDMNGWCYVHSYQVAYIFQMGIPEWDSATTYETNSVVQGPRAGASAGQWFVSLQDNNTNNALPVSTSNAWWSWANSPLPTVPQVGNSIGDGIVVKPNSGAPATKTDITADLLSVQGVVLSTVSLTGDITATGANGFDTNPGTPPPSTAWIAFHAITNASGSLSACLYSLSRTAPTLPAGYTKFRFMGWLNRASGSFYSFVRVNNFVYYDDASAIKFTGLVTSTVDLSTAMPPSSVVASLAMDLSGSSGVTMTFKPHGSSMPSYLVQQTSISNYGGTIAVVETLRVSTAQKADIVVSGAVAPTNPSITVLGYEDSIQ